MNMRKNKVKKIDDVLKEKHESLYHGVQKMLNSCHNL